MYRSKYYLLRLEFLNVVTSISGIRHPDSLPISEEEKLLANPLGVVDLDFTKIVSLNILFFKLAE